MSYNRYNRCISVRGFRYTLLFIVILVGLIHPSPPNAEAQDAVRFFPETGESVGGKFLQYWETHGGLAQQGYPISSEIGEQSPTDGKVYTVQYFERAVFEFHPENPPPYDVLLSLLGSFYYHGLSQSASRTETRAVSPEVPNTSAGSVLFPQTGKRLAGDFLAYWKTHGGLAQQGYPISDEFTEEQMPLNGPTQQYRVQYFERAEFEYHPENPASSRVLLSQLGTFRYYDKYLFRQSSQFLTPPHHVSPALANLSGGPTDPQAYAYYLASNYGTIGSVTLHFSQITGSWNGGPGGQPLPTLAVDWDTASALSVDMHRQDIERIRRWEAAWALAVQADATVTWPRNDFVITLDGPGIRIVIDKGHILVE